VGLGDVSDDRIVKGAAVATVAVEGDAADRRPSLRKDAVLRIEVLDLSLLEVGVALDLVDRRRLVSLEVMRLRRDRQMSSVRP
jgi:hypothetical protein